MGKIQETIKSLQKILEDLGGDDELMELYGDALEFAIKCVKYAERNRWHDYSKEKPRNGERVIYDILDIATYDGIGDYWEGHDFNSTLLYGDEEHVYWKPYYNDKIEEGDLNAI